MRIARPVAPVLPAHDTMFKGDEFAAARRRAQNLADVTMAANLRRSRALASASAGRKV